MHIPALTPAHIIPVFPAECVLLEYGNIIPTNPQPPNRVVSYTLAILNSYTLAILNACLSF